MGPQYRFVLRRVAPLLPVVHVLPPPEQDDLDGGAAREVQGLRRRRARARDVRPRAKPPSVLRREGPARAAQAEADEGRGERVVRRVRGVAHEV